ncbi:MAG: hypothetical protein GF355_04125, partial [Candidatus Eisenbacteria bacterium]|nr:hypothetical protein [Candidatus Eisenbacteria bacterium]
MKRLTCWSCILVLAACFVIAQPVRAEWIALGAAETGVQVLEENDQRIVVEFNLEGLDKEIVRIDGRDCAMYWIPDMPILLRQGEPQLPVVRQGLIIPDQGAW